MLAILSPPASRAGAQHPLCHPWGPPGPVGRLGAPPSVTGRSGSHGCPRASVSLSHPPGATAPCGGKWGCPGRALGAPLPVTPPSCAPPEGAANRSAGLRLWWPDCPTGCPCHPATAMPPPQCPQSHPAAPSAALPQPGCGGCGPAVPRVRDRGQGGVWWLSVASRVRLEPPGPPCGLAVPAAVTRDRPGLPQPRGLRGLLAGTGAGVCHPPPVPRAAGASLGELSPLNAGGVTAAPRALSPGPPRGVQHPPTPAVSPTPGGTHLAPCPQCPPCPPCPQCPLCPLCHPCPHASGSHLTVSQATTSFYCFSQQNPLLFWAPLRFLFPAFSWVGFGFFFPFLSVFII
ncbi:uncharacterized protein LOC132339306 [Haemorhous mexicanus]|uniref:uncharacterized protein LOC132339306 n=1 Tax=Haemorhous mexicanus TaxID=30427 RepID=UPI0028BD2E61|nr:uncharacterized protein LOC132339306 [Haemorhous mexicanus]